MTLQSHTPDFPHSHPKPGCIDENTAPGSMRREFESHPQDETKTNLNIRFHFMTVYIVSFYSSISVQEVGETYISINSIRLI